MPSHPSTSTTVQITETLDVAQRLHQQQIWQQDWQDQDQRLERIILEVDDAKPLGAQTGLQAASTRQLLRLALIREPLEILPDMIERVGYHTLRQALVHQFAALATPDRQRWLWNFLFLMTPDLRRLYDKIDRVRGYRALGQQRNFLLGGPSGMGKTTCLDWFVFNHPPVIEATRNWIPIVKVNAPYSNQSAHRLLRQMILQCGKTYLQSDREGDLLDKIVLYFQKCAVEVLIIDEIQHLRTHGMRRRLLEISNETRGIPIICASCHPTEFVHGDPEIAGRWNDYFELKPYTGQRLEELLAFIELLLPFTQPSYLAFRRLEQGKMTLEGPAVFIERCTAGILRDIMLLITEASLLALDQGVPALSLDILQQAWSSIQENRVEDFLQLLQKKNHVPL
jgi:hypothetical protein